MLADVLSASLANPRQSALRSVRQHGRPRDLRDKLLHPLAHPPGGIRPEPRLGTRIEALDRTQQADDSRLQQLGALNAGDPAVAAGYPCDRRQELFDELLARSPVTCVRGEHELALTA